MAESSFFQWFYYKNWFFFPQQRPIFIQKVFVNLNKTTVMFLFVMKPKKQAHFK